ncbi:MAG: DNA-binding domain-containing protein [Bacteroidota bacterium]
MRLREDTARIQDLLGDYCRTGEGEEIPGITPGRLSHYRRLVYNVIRDTLDRAFPITLAALGEAHWDLLVDDFFSNGFPQTPQIWKLPLEFYNYHNINETGTRIQKPYLEDLLYFEWIEIEVHTMPDRPFPEYESQGNIFTDRLAFNPEFEIILLEYPVHMYPAWEAEDRKGDYYVLIFREPDSGKVQFLNLSVIHTYILSLLMEEDRPLNQLKGEIAQTAGIESMKYLDDALEKFTGDLMQKKLILGFQKE